jgi:hypothetical protein
MYSSMYRADTSVRYGPPGGYANSARRWSPKLVCVETTRSFIDYALARRATLAALFGGRATVTDVCDAHPYLLRAAKHHGEATDEVCLVCRKEQLTRVTYIYGDALGQYSGRIKATRELAELEYQVSEFKVYVVEVCQGCGWNHLRETYVLGHGGQGGQRGEGDRAQARAAAGGRASRGRVTHSRERALSE